MKQIYVLIFLLSANYIFFSHVAQSQSVIIQYDNAGNRILRKQNAPLPVTLISFTATKVSGDLEGYTALLNWQTSAEINSDRFNIERSQDGKKWLDIGTVKSNGDKTTNSYYSFIDKAPTDGENLYRLKMIDKDETFSFSRIQSLNFESQITFYPNPVKDLLKLKGVPSGAPADGTIQLFNTSGKSVLSLGNIPANGINISGLPTGIYMIKISLKDGTSIIRKVVKE